MKVTPAITARARGLVHEHVLLSGGAALIPEPILCTTAVTAALLRMLEELSRLYGKPFHSKTVQVLVVGASGGALTYLLLARPAVRRAIAVFAPVILPLWCIGGAVLAGSLTRCLGQAFIRHYEGGGTYRDFDWDGFRAELQARLGVTAIQATVGAQLALARHEALAGG